MTERQPRSYDGLMMEKGKVGEKAVTEWLERRGFVVVDVSDHEAMQQLDVDLVVARKDEKPVLCEVKTDYIAHITNNICFEVIRVYHGVGALDRGWAVKSPADYLFYVLPQANKFYCFYFKEFRTKAVKHIETAGKDLKSTTVETDKGKTTHNFLIPLSALNGSYKEHRLDSDAPPPDHP